MPGTALDQDIEANGTAHQDADDRAGPALADQLDRLVVESADDARFVSDDRRIGGCGVGRAGHATIIARLTYT